MTKTSIPSTDIRCAPLMFAVWATRLMLVVLLAVASGGCAKYWTRDQATLADFAKDHKECLTSTGVPVVNDPSRVVPNEQEYRRCLIARGWSRQNASWLEVPAGYYRGYEEREEFKPVKVDELPEQPVPYEGTRR